MLVDLEEISLAATVLHSSLQNSVSVTLKRKQIWAEIDLTESVNSVGGGGGFSDCRASSEAVGRPQEERHRHRSCQTGGGEAVPDEPYEDWIAGITGANTNPTKGIQGGKPKFYNVFIVLRKVF